MDTKKEIDRRIENELIAFSGTLAPNMNPQDIIRVYKDLEDKHWVIEAKIMMMRTIFHDVLREEFAKEEAALGPEAAQSMFG